ncbi:O-antigen ligase family protein [Candidatus Falkowbacteria bacterium]|nr:O-antigen ligase family protein [Candidatus Falkowbacteria bacterium]
MSRTLEKIYLYIIWFGIAMLFFVPLLVTKQFFFPYIFGKTIAIRMIVEVIAVLFILLVFLNRKYMPKRTWLFWGVVVYMAILGITSLTGVNPFHSFWSNYERMEGFLTLIHFGILFVIMSGVLRTKEAWKRLLRVVVLGGFIVAVIGLLQKLDVGFVIGAGIAKVNSTLGNSTYVASYLGSNVFLLIYLFFKDKKLYWRIPYVLAGLLNLLVIFFTASRGGVVGLIGGLLGLLFLILFFAPRGVLRKTYKYGIIGFIVLMLLFGGFVYGNKDHDWVENNHALRKLTTLSLQDRTIRDRFINAKIGLKAMGDKFFLGWGLENYYVPFNKYYAAQTSEPWFDRAHNVIFDQAVTSGIFGLLSYLFLIGAAVYYFWKQRKRGDYLTGFIFISLVAASFFANLFVFDSSTTYTIFFTVLAFGNFLGCKNKEEEEGDIPQRGPANIFIPVLLIAVLALCLYFFNIRPAIANNLAIKGYQYSRVDYQKSHDFYEKAFNYNTFGNAEISLRIADHAVDIFDNEDLDKNDAKAVLLFTGDALDRALEQEPLNARHYLQAGQTYHYYFVNVDDSQEYLDKTEEYYREAIELSPTRPDSYLAWAQLMFNLGRYDEAVSNTQKAFSINPDRMTYYRMFVLYLYLKDARADELFEEIYEKGYFAIYGRREMMSLINIYNGRDDYDKIIKMLEYTVVYKTSESEREVVAEYHAKLAAVYKEVGNIDKAREHAEKAVEIDPSMEAAVDIFLKDL